MTIILFLSAYVLQLRIITEFVESNAVIAVIGPLVVLEIMVIS